MDQDRFRTSGAMENEYYATNQQQTTNEEDDEDYQPTQQEIIDYAKFLGMNLPEDNDLLYIAEQGLTQPVPEPWKVYSNQNEEIIYCNTVTGQEIYDHPMDGHYKQLVKDAQNAKQKNGGAGAGSAMQQSNLAGGNNSSKQPAFLNKAEDPLIKAETEKQVKEQKILLENEFKDSLKEIDRNFELRKQELVQQNSADIERETAKWEQKRQTEEKRLRREAEEQADQQLREFKEKLQREEEQEARNIQMQADAQIKQYQQELDLKLQTEKKEIQLQYERIKTQVQQTEQEWYDFEIAKFKKLQESQFAGKKSDVARLQDEKRKVQQDYQTKVEEFRRETDRKLDQQKRLLQDTINKELAEMERAEERKFEQELQKIKQEHDAKVRETGSTTSQELQRYKEELEREAQRELQDYKRQQQDLVRKEESKLEQERQVELQEYETMLRQQFEADLRRRQTKLQLQKDAEERELEIQKLKIDQMYEEQLAEHKRQVQAKYERERRGFEEEKRKRQQDVQSAIDRLQVPATEKDSLRRELESLVHDQRQLQVKIDDVERELETEKAKKRAAEREVNELNIQESQRKLESGQESTRVQWLREEIAKKNAQISAANREYKTVLETRTDHVMTGNMHTQAPRSAAADSAGIKKLESELNDIKSMLTDFATKKNNAATATDYMAALQLGTGFADDEFGFSTNDVHNPDYIKQQKQQVKEMQEKLEKAKSQYKTDKAAVEEMRLSDPVLYRKKSEVLAQVKEGLDKRIAQINQKVAQVKSLEASQSGF